LLPQVPHSTQNFDDQLAARVALEQLGEGGKLIPASGRGSTKPCDATHAESPRLKSIPTHAGTPLRSASRRKRWFRFTFIRPTMPAPALKRQG
jgi:hypothetical protein